MDYIGVYPIMNMSVEFEDAKEVYKREVRYRTVGNETMLETRYYTKEYERLYKVEELVYIDDETMYMDQKYYKTITYFEYKGA